MITQKSYEMPFPVPSNCFSPPMMSKTHKHTESCVMRTVIYNQSVLTDKNIIQMFPNRSRSSFFRKFVPVAACASSEWEGHEDENRLPGVRRVRETSETDGGWRQTISEMEINEWLEKETGMDRVRIMFSTSSDGTFIDDDTRTVNTMFRRTIILGAVVSIFMAASRNQGKKEKHVSASQAVIKGLVNEHKAAKGVLKEALTTTLRLTVFSFPLLYVSQAIAAYRNKSSVWEYVISSTLAFGLANVGQSVQRCAAMSLAGAVIGGVGGLAVCSILSSQGLSQEQKHIERIRHYLQEQNLTQQRQPKMSSTNQ